LTGKAPYKFESFFLSRESSKLGVALIPVATSKDAALTGAASRRGLETVRKHWAVRGAVATASRSDLVIRKALVHPDMLGVSFR